MSGLCNSEEQARAQAAGDEMVRQSVKLLGHLPDEGEAQMAVDVGDQILSAALLGLTSYAGAHLPSSFRGLGHALGFFVAQLPKTEQLKFSTALNTGLRDGLKNATEAFTLRGNA